jgi:hypothetical protein
MDRRRQPAMPMGGSEMHEEHHWVDAAGFDHTAPRVLTRGWALVRLIVLVLFCGVGAAATVAISIAILVALIGEI